MNFTKIDSNNYYKLIKLYGKDKVNKEIDDAIRKEIDGKELTYEFSLNLWDKYGYFLAVNDNCYNSKFVNNNNNNFWTEKGFGLDLLKRNYIKIFKGNDIDIDLIRVFGSIDDDKSRDYVIDRLNYLVSNCGRSSNFDKYMIDYINNTDVSDVKCNDRDKLRPEEVIDNIDMYVKYSIARNVFMVRNIKMLSDIANSFNSDSVSFDDMYMEGFLGLVRCIQKYDVRKENKFYTYAYCYVYRYIFRAIYRKNNMVRIPTYILEERSKINNAFWYLYDINGKNPSDLEIANYLKVDVKKVIDLKEIFRVFDCDSLDRKVYIDDDLSLGDIVCNDSFKDIDNLLFDECFEELYGKIKEKLSKKEFDIIIDRVVYGKKLNVMGAHYGCTGENIRQIEYRALKKIRSIPDINNYSNI